MFAACRRDHLEPHHLVLRAAVVVVARPDRRPRRRGVRRRRRRALGRASSTRWSSRWWCRRWSGSCSAFLLMLAILWAVPAGATRGRSTAASGSAQIASAAAMAFGHGLQDAQKTMGVIALALVTGGYIDGGRRHAALGHPVGRRRCGARHLLRRLANHADPARRKVIELDPPAGFARPRTPRPAVLCFTAAALAGGAVWGPAPIASSIMVRGSRRLSAVAVGPSRKPWKLRLFVTCHGRAGRLGGVRGGASRRALTPVCGTS